MNSTRVRDLNNWCFGNFRRGSQQGLKEHRSGLDREFKNGWNVGGKDQEISSWTRYSSVGFFGPPLRATCTVLISVHSHPIFIWFRV